MSVLSRVLLAAAFFASSVCAQELKVAAASDLSAAMQKLGPAFEQQTGIHVSVSLGSSGNFFAQLQNGAPFDVFLSADKSYPEKLEQAGLAEPGSLAAYARGKLVVWWQNSAHLEFSSKNLLVLSGNLDPLKSTEVHKIAIANPEHAPYGRAAVAALQHFGIYEQIKPKLVLGENISQTAQFAQSGNAEVAFVALALALSSPMQQAGHYLLLPSDSYPPLEQAAVVMRASKNKALARRFIEFLRSQEGQKALRDFGFEIPIGSQKK